MASKTQKVITPENLGQGIAYNPQTKKWEVHFVSEAEIEQVQGYVEPQEDDEHYVTKECIKLRERASGYMWDSCKSTLKDRAPARDEEATLTPRFVLESGHLMFRPELSNSNIDGTLLRGSYEEDFYDVATRFTTTKELNEYLKGKKAKFTTEKRFANTLEGKPMIRPTALEASYPVVEDEILEATYSIGNMNYRISMHVSYGEQFELDKILASNKNSVKLIVHEPGKQPVETDITSRFRSTSSPRDICVDLGYRNIENSNVKIQFSPSTVTIERLGYKINGTFVNFDNGVVVRNERNIQASDLSNVHWDPLNVQGGAILSDKYKSVAADPMKVLNLSYTTKNGVQHVSGGISVTEANAKLANEAHRGKTFTIDQVRGFTEDNGTIVKDGSVEYPWVDLPYIETNATVSWKDVNGQGASLDVVTVDNDQDGYIAELIKNRLKEERDTEATFILSDLDGSNEVRDENVQFSNYENPTFMYSSRYNGAFDGSGKQFKLRVEFKPVVIEAFVGKFTVNFQPIEYNTTH